MAHAYILQLIIFFYIITNIRFATDFERLYLITAENHCLDENCIIRASLNAIRMWQAMSCEEIKNNKTWIKKIFLLLYSIKKKKGITEVFREKYSRALWTLKKLDKFYLWVERIKYFMYSSPTRIEMNLNDEEMEAPSVSHFGPRPINLWKSHLSLCIF